MRTKPIAQTRSEEKHRRILAAMESLLRTMAFDEITIADIAAEADVSPATIYQRFRNRDAAGAILLELYFQRVEDWAARPRATAVSEPLQDALLRLARDSWDQAAALGHVMRPAYLYSRRWPERTGDDWKRLEAIAAKGFRAFIEHHAEEITIADKDKAAGTLGFAVNMLVAGLLLHGADMPLPLLQDRETFASELVDLCHRYLTPPSGPRG